MKIVIAGWDELTPDLCETAILLGFDVLNLDFLGNSQIVDTEIIRPQDIDSDLRKLPIIMSTAEYSTFCHLPPLRRAIQNRLQLFSDIESLGFKNWMSLIHPSAVISTSAKVGDNVFINANTTVASNTKVSDNCLINRNVAVGHNVNIGSFCEIGPAVNITGGTQINDKVFIGAGAIIINEVKIGTEATVAAGSLVTRDVRDQTLVMGSPARIKVV